jgi:chaperonin GroES
MIRPIGNKVVVRPFKSDEETKGGIIVPEAYREESDKMLVVAVSERSKWKVGDVVFRVHGHKDGEIFIDGVLHYIINQDTLIAKQENADTTTVHTS